MTTDTINIIIISMAAVICTAVICYSIIKCKTIASEERIEIQDLNDKRLNRMLSYQRHGSGIVTLKKEADDER